MILHFGTFPWGRMILHFGTFPWGRMILHFGTFPEILELFPGKEKEKDSKM